MTEYNYGILLKNGVRIYEYLPGFIHSKVVLNEHCAVVGTINMDYRSFYLHYENGVWVYDDEFKKKVLAAGAVLYSCAGNRRRYFCSGNMYLLCDGNCGVCI